jgi:hypothetical protein
MGIMQSSTQPYQLDLQRQLARGGQDERRGAARSNRGAGGGGVGGVVGVVGGGAVHDGRDEGQQERHGLTRAVAVQVECESKGLKPGYHISGSRVGSPGAFKLWCQLDSTCTAPPSPSARRRARRGPRARAARCGAGSGMGGGTACDPLPRGCQTPTAGRAR